MGKEEATDHRSSEAVQELSISSVPPLQQIESFSEALSGFGSSCSFSQGVTR